MVSGMFGMNAATRSPTRRPCTPSAEATRDASAWSSRCDMRRRTLSSPQNTSASPASVGALRSSRFCAKLSRASGNHFAPGMRSPSTSVRSPRLPITPPSSHTSRQKTSGDSIDQRHSEA